MPISTIAILSPGNMGSAVGRFLVEGGFDVVACLGERSDFTRERAEKYGIRDIGGIDDMVAASDLVLSILDPARAEEIAEATAAAMKKAGKSLVFADCNATSPATAEKLNGLIEEAGGKFVDVGIIGGAPDRKENFPNFCTSGPHAELLQPLDGKGVKILKVGDEIGAGSAIKICNGAWNKGAFALYTAVMLAAEHYGFTEILRERLPKSQAGTVDKLDAAINRLPSLSGRYVGEMEQVAETFASIGMPDGFHDASAQLFRMLNDTSLGSERRELIPDDRTTLDVLKVLIQDIENS